MHETESADTSIVGKAMLEMLQEWQASKVFMSWRLAHHGSSAAVRSLLGTLQHFDAKWRFDYS